jgi:Putative peptidoglycan binding domain
LGGNVGLNLPAQALRSPIVQAVVLLLTLAVVSMGATGPVKPHHSTPTKRRRHRAVASPRHRTVTSRKRAAVSHSARRRTYAKYHRRHVYHRPTATRSKVRFASLHMQPARAEQIQQALISAGDLHESPTGRWDTQTRDAMRRYQQQNGFGVTGMPDAKSLMKMGLGPHPLPPDADPLASSFRPNAPGDKSSDSGSQQDQPDN